MRALCVDPSRFHYHALIGSGGIGSGRFFALNGNHTLGREESRSGRFLERKDYCKLHIVAHYVRTLLGPDFVTLPIGIVGDDEPGRRLCQEMTEAGLNLRYVRAMPGEQTMYSICLVYPDGSGGNLTADDSACARVDPAFIRQAEADFAAHAGQGIAVAMPEVPLAARAAVLQLGTEHRFLRVASFTSEEMASARNSGMLAQVDLLAVNVDEAAALADPGMEEPVPAASEVPRVVEGAIEVLRHIQPGTMLSITASARGSWSWDSKRLVHIPAYPVEVAGTAGAGDAHLAGILAGLAAGLSLGEAHELGALTAALSVTSPHTIHKGIDRLSLQALAEQLARQGMPVCTGVRQLLAG